MFGASAESITARLLEQMGSADPPLAIHGLYSGRHRQHRRRRTGEVQL